ncbi:MAG: hypothetical protein M2R45_03538 [Verrucomicrobia subdivision 3 bacterium]|nr:hypothetical protein [Limisphaerales bacterium]MCS1416485.1 hypothetical protein [Limisphaerales bacterium]
MTTDWKRKLADYLHDPPSKCLDIRTHGERSDTAFRQAGFSDDEVGKYHKAADHTAAAADRLPFPKSQSLGIRCVFDGIHNTFRHPLNGGRQLKFHKEFASVEQGFEGEQSVQPRLSEGSLAKLSDEWEHWRARFFAHWRLWPKFTVDKDYRYAFLPADTRIPDHTIWTHMQMVAALGGCVQSDKKICPVFLKFQLGPVQDFIAAARSTRDLWSGSYLLSWLMAAGLKKLSEEVGPDAVVFPSLRDQPLFDLHWRDDLWNRVYIGDASKKVWETLGWKDRELLTPNLPNVFLAVVPEDRAKALAETTCGAIEAEWECIADAVWKACSAAGLTDDEEGIIQVKRKDRYEKQVGRFLSLSWQCTPWPKTLDEAMSLAKGFDDKMPVSEAEKRVEKVIRMATEQMPKEHRDQRFYTDGTKTNLNNIGLAWSVILTLNGWQLDAVRQTRVFSAVNEGGWDVGTFCNKDALTGCEEAVAGGRVWGERARLKDAPWKSLFKHDDWLGASTLVKRVWHHAYLRNAPWSIDTNPSHFLPMPNTRGIAAHDPFKDCGDDETAEDAPPSEKYFAVIAFDGDEIGKWVSGEKMPPFKDQLADYNDRDGQVRQGALAYFERDAFAKFLETARPLSPSYHLQLSEALANFALRCARPIVEVFDGRLIYAGGDDVLAMVPADTALACAQALRKAFRGDTDIGDFLQRHAKRLQNVEREKHPSKYQEMAAKNELVRCKCEEARGFLERLDLKDDNGRPIPFIVPGPKADASAGIAIAHFKAPLQDVVREAQASEKRAKRKIEDGGYGRSAFAVTLMKRSGEINHWGGRWDKGGLCLYAKILCLLEQNVVSAKFPHRIIEFVKPYLSVDSGSCKLPQDAETFSEEIAQRILLREIELAADRQRGPNYSSKIVEELKSETENYLRAVSDVKAVSDEAEARAKKETPQRMVSSLIGLCHTVAFAHRTREADKPASNRNNQV